MSDLSREHLSSLPIPNILPLQVLCSLQQLLSLTLVPSQILPQ